MKHKTNEFETFWAKQAPKGKVYIDIGAVMPNWWYGGKNTLISAEQIQQAPRLEMDVKAILTDLMLYIRRADGSEPYEYMVQYIYGKYGVDLEKMLGLDCSEWPKSGLGGM